jgi:hypothetical protein
MWKHEKLEDKAKYGGRSLYLVGAKLMGHNRSQITIAPYQWWGSFWGEELRGR